MPDNQPPDISSIAPPQDLAAVANAPVPAPQLATQPVVPVRRNLPNAAALVADLIRPRATQVQAKPGELATATSVPGSRLEAFENFLGNFLGALGAGMSQSGQRGAQGKGFAAAINYPMQHQFQQSQLEQQSAEAELRRSQAGLAQRQSEMGTVYIPGIGQVTAPMGQFGNIFRGAGAASVGAQGREAVAKITADNRTEVERMKLNFQAGMISKVLPVQDANGQPVMRAFNKFGQPIADIENALIPQLLPKQSSTVEYKQLDDGSIVALPKTTVTKPVVPGAGGPMPSGRGGITAPAPVKDAQGNPIVGKGAITSTTRTMVETAPKVMDLVGRIKGQIAELQQSGELGPAASRWNEFWSGKVGQDNPRFRALQTNTTLLSTLLMRMHMGARGGQQIMEHFDQMIGSGHQSAANMLATMDQIEAYANEVRGAAPLPANYGKGGQAGGPKVGDTQSGYRFKGGNPSIRTNWEKQ